MNNNNLDNVETYEIPVTLDGLIHILDFNKYCLSDNQIIKLKDIIKTLTKEAKEWLKKILKIIIIVSLTILN